MAAWKPLAVCLVVAPCALAQQSPLPSEGVIFDDFQYESTEWCRELDGSCDTQSPPGYPPAGSLYGRNEWVITENGDTEYKRAWYQSNWHEHPIDYPHPSSSLHAGTDSLFGYLTFRADADNYPPGANPQQISSGFASRRGTWAARVNFGDMEPASMGAMIQAFWLISPAVSLDVNGNWGRNEIDIEWNNFFRDQNNQNYHYLSTVHHTGHSFWPGNPPRRVPLFSPSWPDGDGGVPIEQDWSCKFIWDENGPNEDVAMLEGEDCSKIINKQTIQIDCPGSSCREYTPNHDPWILLFVQVTENDIFFRIKSLGWGGTIFAKSQRDDIPSKDRKSVV